MVLPDGTQRAIKHGACTVHAGNLRLQTPTQNTKYLLLVNGTNSYANAPQYYVIRTLPALLSSLASEF
jgi:hypothetical protein